MESTNRNQENPVPGEPLPGQEVRGAQGKGKTRNKAGEKPTLLQHYNSGIPEGSFRSINEATPQPSDRLVTETKKEDVAFFTHLASI